MLTMSSAAKRVPTFDELSRGRTTVTIQNSDMNQATTTPSGTSTPDGPGANLPTK